MRPTETPRCVLHLFLEPAQRFGGLLAIVRELGLLFALAQAIRGVAMRKHLPCATFLILFVLLYAVRFAGHCVHLLPGLSLLHAAQQVGSLLQTFGGAARGGVIWLTLRSCASHIFLRLTQAIERLLHAVIGR